MLRQLMCEQFPKLTWGAMARRRAAEHGISSTADLKAGLRSRASPAARSPASDIERPMPPLWQRIRRACRCADAGYSRRQFRPPVRRHPLAANARRGAPPPGTSSKWPTQGHAPLLEGDLVSQIVGFVDKCEHAGQPRTDDQSKPLNPSFLLPARFCN